MTEEEHKALTAWMKELSGEVGKVLEKSENIETKVEKIEDAIYDPDTGLYARVKNVEIHSESANMAIKSEVIPQGKERMLNVERTTKGINRVTWIAIGAVVLAVVTALIALL